MKTKYKKTRLKKATHKSLIPLLIMLVSALVLVGIRSHIKTQAQVAGNGHKNVVIIMTDDQVYESANGPYSVMRNLNASPYGNWVNFTNAFANSSICCPSRSTVLTGRDSFHTGVIDNSSGAQLDASNTLPVWLNDAGYETALFGKYLNFWPFLGSQNPPPGWDKFDTNGIGKTDEITNKAVNFINQTTGSYFLYVAYGAPHNPAANKVPARYQNSDVPIIPDPPNFDEADVSDKPAWVRSQPRLSATDINYIRTERLQTQRALLAVDDGVKQIMDTIAAKNQLDQTLVIFMSDHGYSFGSHRHINKFCAYEECSHFPLYIRYPGLGSNRTENRLVSTLNIAATINEFTGVAPRLTQDGASLVPLMTDTATNWPNEILLEKLGSGNRQKFWGIRTPNWKYIEYFNGDKELYDLENDPYELNNRINDPALQAKKLELKTRLEAIKPK